MSEEQKLDGRTKRALDTTIAKRQVSQDSYRAVLEGRITLQEARELGRNAGPSGPAVRVNKADRSRPCLACGGPTKGGIFHPGCDAKMHRLAREYVRDERELTPEQLDYIGESGKLDRAKAQVEKENRRKAERAARKAGEE